ncbi:hypothetical protein [Brumimicrobium mesophilum]|uniref:hypothetical protein n=1 Tax=Brumimicrobium mesophilum TaxID=392717 RepID=UPI00131C8505|nr:hypothetical protein [Brumimicrobium mesophilum]
MIRKTTISLLFISFFSLGMTENPISSKPDSATTVYVCGESKIYHKIKSHAALGRCKSGITKMTEAKAEELGKRVCKCKN